MAIARSGFGNFRGREVEQFRLTSPTGVEVDLITYGAVVRDWRVPVGDGRRSVTIGFDRFEDYPLHSQHFGSLAGRVANRIADAGFDMDGRHYALQDNRGGYILHGGDEGLGLVLWEAEPDEAANAVRFSQFSPHGHMGFPGNVRFTATYRLTGNRLRLDLAASTDRKTPINVVQHLYFNLGTGPDVLDHRYRIAASAYTENGENLIPTGAILPVDGTKWDLRQARTMRDAAGRPIDYDGNLVLDQGRDPSRPVAEVEGPDGALTLRLWTDRPGVQLYNSVWTDVPVPGIGGRELTRFCGFCLEDQDFPDAVHRPYFPPIWYEPGRDYHHWCEIEIA